MKALSKLNITILLSIFVVLPICNSIGNINKTIKPTPINPIPESLTPSTPIYQETILHSFTGGNDGAQLYSGVIHASDGNFYGTTVGGGKNDNGTVYKITPQGVETILHSFTGGGNDGEYPQAGLIQGSDGNFYGTTGGANTGTVFKITPQGQLITLYRFTGGTDGSQPVAGLIQGRDGNFYGTTGGGNGTVFKITPQGVKAILYSFAGRKDGAFLYSGVIQASDGNFYGTTGVGGAFNDGTVFKITPQGVKITLYSFVGGLKDGAHPQAGVIQASDGNFYGTTTQGGNGEYNNFGTVFKITPQGVETILHSFANDGTDGISPFAGLIQGRDGNFYGTTYYGGDGCGTVFKITPQGQEIVLYSFAYPGTDGVKPQAALIQDSDGNFYGTTQWGGIGGNGTVFKLTPQ